MSAGTDSVVCLLCMQCMVQYTDDAEFCFMLQHIWMVDSKGLITKKRGDKLPSHKLEMAREDDPPLKDLKDIIAHVKPHALIGLSGAGPSFKKARLLPEAVPFN